MKPKRSIHALLPNLEGANTMLEMGASDAPKLRAGEEILVVGRSLVLLRSDRTAQFTFG